MIPIATASAAAAPAPSPTPGVDPADERLVEEARAGSRRAFEALVRRYQKPLYFLCYRYVKDHDVAADLTQRTFIRVMEKLGELREVQIFRGWLFRIGVNLSLNHLRDHARFVDEPAGEREEPGGDPEPIERITAGEDAEALRRAVTQLPTKQRMTLELRVFEELSFREVAVALDTTEGAAKVNFHYAVRRLKSLLGADKAGGP